MLRSEEMTLCQLIERNEMARIVVTELGEAGLVQFRDMNGDTPVYKRPFSEELKRCDDMSRKVTWLFNQLENVGLPAPEYDLPEDGVEMLPGLDAVEDALKAAKTELEASRTQELLVRKAHNALKEHIHVLNVGGQLFEEAAPAKPRGQTRDTKSSYDQVSTLAAPLLASDFGTGKGPSGHEESLLRVQAGVLPRALTPALVRAVHRITRGNCVVRDMPIEEPLLGMPADGRYGDAYGRHREGHDLLPLARDDGNHDADSGRTRQYKHQQAQDSRDRRVVHGSEVIRIDPEELLDAAHHLGFVEDDQVIFGPDDDIGIRHQDLVAAQYSGGGDALRKVIIAKRLADQC
jgi:hypothetical protein